MKMVVTKEKGNAHLINNKKLVMSYKEQGMIKSTLFRPNLIYRYKPKENVSSSSVEKRKYQSIAHFDAPHDNADLNIHVHVV